MSSTVNTNVKRDMKFSVITLFPEQVEANLNTSIVGRALRNRCFELDLIQLRDFALNDYGQVDDTIYGGGVGMLLACEPIFRAWQHAVKHDEARTLFMTPTGRPVTQDLVAEFSEEKHLVILCGHYEGVDERILERIQAEPISIGDFVVSGGEMAASMVIDATVRLLPGVLPETAAENESFACGLLEERHYTKPAKWHDRDVPDVLLSGHFAKIERHRRCDRLWQTLQKRPDLLYRNEIGPHQWREFFEWYRESLENKERV